MRFSAPFIVIVGMSAGLAMCAPGDGDPVPSGHAVGRSSSHVTGGSAVPYGPRGRVVWEAARAMVGASAASGIVWGTIPVFGRNPYVGEDVGAWNVLRSAYTPHFVSCRADDDKANNHWPCTLMWGTTVPYRYACQGMCPSARNRGGQCKAFANLVAYRAGIAVDAGSGIFKRFPDDASGIMERQPYAVPGALQAGDILRRVDHPPHAAIVVRVVSPTQVVVVDSNWVGGSGGEAIGSHGMDFSGKGVADLSTYHVLACVYDGTC